MHKLLLGDLTRLISATLTTGLLVATTAPIHAYDINDRFSVNALIAAGGQCQDGSGDIINDDGTISDFHDTCRGALPIQLDLSFHPTERDELFVALAYAIENGLNEVSPFVLAPWAANLEDDVKDINGRNRDYLLQAWYKHSFRLGEEATLGATLGIIDSTSYLDENAYANDEYTQFMNEAFVNSGGFNLPSYDVGAALEFATGQWSLKAAALDIGENDDGNRYQFWGAQLGYRLDTRLGEGNYRAVVTGTSKDFLRPADESLDQAEEDDLMAMSGPANKPDKTGLVGYGVSFDQALGEYLGAFMRLSWTEHKDILTYRGIYTGGLSISGGPWGRGNDQIGLAYGVLDGANTGMTRTNVAEAYYRLVLNDYLAVTADVQYLSDDYDEAETIDGWILGLRAVVEL